MVDETTLYCGLDVKEASVRAVVADGRGRLLQRWEISRDKEGFRELMGRLEVLQRCNLMRVVVVIPAGDAAYAAFGWPYSSDYRVQGLVMDTDELFFIQGVLKEVVAEDRRAFLMALLAREERLCAPYPIGPAYLGF